MTNHEQIYLEVKDDFEETQGKDFTSLANILRTAKSLVVGDRKVTLDPNKGLLTNYVVRGVNTTGYSALVVFDSDLSGFHTIRTNGDYGNATINMNHPGQKGQEVYIKIDNDSDGNKTITFGTPFKATGTISGSTSASAVLHFISDGTSFFEVSRTTGLPQ